VVRRQRAKSKAGGEANIQKKVEQQAIDEVGGSKPADEAGGAQVGANFGYESSDDEDDAET